MFCLDFMGGWELQHSMILIILISRPHSKVAKLTNRHQKELCWKLSLVNMSYNCDYIHTCSIYLYVYIFFLHNMMLNLLFDFTVSDFLCVAEVYLLAREIGLSVSF